jgi:hypothetical protein
MFEFLTFPARTRKFLTLCLNFSLFLRGHPDFSLFACRAVICRRGQPVNIMVLTMSLGRPVTRKGPASDTKRAGRRGSVAGWKSENSLEK